MLKKTIRDSAIATLAGLVPHYLAFYLFGSGLLTETVATWLMGHAPDAVSLSLLDAFGPWTRPIAAMVGLLVLGFCLWLPALLSYWRNRKYERFLILVVLMVPGIVLIQNYFGYHSQLGSWAFWLPALLTLMIVGKPHLELIDEDWGEASEYAMQFVGRGKPQRGLLDRMGRFSLPVIVLCGLLLVAVESYVRRSIFQERGTAASAVSMTIDTGAHFQAIELKKQVILPKTTL